jgi:single-stranded-DNA-specific exonuclease
VRKHVGEGVADATLNISAWISPGQINEGLMDELDALRPYGQGNPEPVFGLRRVVFRRRPEIFKARHFRFWVDDERGRGLNGVAWKMADRIPPLGVPLDLAVELNWNFFNDRRLLQLELVDWRQAT